MPQDFINSEQSGLAPSNYRPLSLTDIAKVKKSYSITEPKFAKGSDDTSIYKFATQKVLAWWTKTKAEEAAAAAAGGSGDTGSYSYGGGGGGGGGGGAGYDNPALTGAPEPDTSAKAREGGQAHYVKPVQTDPNTYAKIREGGAPQPLTAKQIADALISAGIPTYKPPAYALASAATLAAWIKQAKAAAAQARARAGTFAGAQR